MEKKDSQEVYFAIKETNIRFNKESFLEYSKRSTEYIYKMLKEEKDDAIKNQVSDELINKINTEKEKYKINKNMDNCRVQYAKLQDYIKQEDEEYIKVYLSIYFYDDVSNNKEKLFAKDKYWNDIWILTYRNKAKNEKINNTCEKCGASMQIIKEESFMKCSYCKNERYFNENEAYWELIDIEIKN